MSAAVDNRDGLRLYSMGKYVVITPVRDEEQYLTFTIDSMVRQTVLPEEWVIVNDGSKDKTGQIAEEASRQYPWIQVVHREDRGFRKWGAGIIEAFYAGFHALTFKDWQFMCKLDGDLSFEPDYFEGAFQQFVERPQIGIGGGVLYHYQGGQRILEPHPMFHVRGGVKIYRRECWDALGGLWVGPGSDTVDEVKANMLGWKTSSFPHLRMTHHRFTGATYGRWGGSVKDGKIDYVTGYHPLFIVAKTIARLKRRPYVFGALAHLFGYLSAYCHHTPRVNDPELIRYLRRQQLARLFGGETIWK